MMERERLSGIMPAEEKREEEEGAANPFDSEMAIRHSNYYRVDGGKPVHATDPSTPCGLLDAAIAGAFRGFIQAPQFSCVGARSAVICENYRLGIYDRLGSPEATAGLARDLCTFSREAATSDPDGFITFAAIFREQAGDDEEDFERQLWSQLRELNRLDAELFEWDPTVSSDPESPHFAFSFASTAYFVVGLHPHSSREARRFPWAALVFNPHAQFVRLREKGQWDRFQKIIRAREMALQGSLNPNLADYGTSTEARQYSGRRVEPDWHPPFDPATSQHHAGSADRSNGGCPFHQGQSSSAGIHGSDI